MSDLAFGLVLPEHLETMWPKMAPWVIQAMGEGVSPEDAQKVKEDIARGTSQLWGVFSEEEGILAVAVTETAVICGRRTLIIRHMGGKEMDRWLSALSPMERWAMSNEFEYVEVWGRPGWIRVLRPHGYRHSFHVLSKAVDKEIH